MRASPPLHSAKKSDTRQQSAPEKSILNPIQNLARFSKKHISGDLKNALCHPGIWFRWRCLMFILHHSMFNVRDTILWLVSNPGSVHLIAILMSLHLADDSSMPYPIHLSDEPVDSIHLLHKNDRGGAPDWAPPRFSFLHKNPKSWFA